MLPFNARKYPQLKTLWVWLALVLPLAAYGAATLQRQTRISVNQRPLFQGVTYSRQVKNQPLPQIIHILEIELTTPGLTPLATPGAGTGTPNANQLDVHETLAQRTSQFLTVHQLQVAINANFFYPFREVTPWNYGPHPGEESNLVGIAIADGALVSLAEPRWPALCFLTQQATIQANGDCPDGTTQAVGGKDLLLEKGEPTGALVAVLRGEERDKAYPMNIVALDETGTRLWLILSDGKQPLYSEGSRLQDVYGVLQRLGASTALRLDGGGSTTLAVASDTGADILNAVIHGKVPGFERPVANHLGFYALPLTGD